MENTNAHVQWVNQNKPSRKKTKVRPPFWGRRSGSAEGANTVSEWKLCLEHGAKEGAGAERRSEMSGPEMS